MRLWHRLPKSFLRAAMLPLVLLAFAATGTGAALAESHLYRGNAGEPKSLDPHRATGTWENHIIGDMFLGLYTEAANAEPILGAAESVTTSPDGLKWTFKLRAHTWSDGKPVTSSDFVFAFRRILDPATAAEYRELLYPIKNAEAVSFGKKKTTELGVTAPDARTLVIELENPAPFLPQLLTHYTSYPLPQHVVEKHGNEWVKPGKMVSNGPYMLQSWRPSDHITLVKNPKFYEAAKVKIDKVTFYPIEDDLAALKRYRAGEIDMNARWPLTEHRWMQANIPAETRKFTYFAVTYWTFNMTRKPFNDIRVRKAIAQAIDRSVIEKGIFFGVYGKEATSILPPGLAGVKNDARMVYAGKTMEARRAESKKLLAEAGYGPNNPLKFSYSYIATPDSRRAAIAMQAMMKQIGVTMELSPAEPKVHYDNLKTKSYDAGNAGWVFDYSDAKNILYLFQSTTLQQNYPGYNNKAFDDFMRQSDKEPDAAKRGALLDAAQAQIMKDIAIAPMFFPYERMIVKPYVQNFVENPRSIFRTRWLSLGPKPKK